MAAGSAMLPRVLATLPAPSVAVLAMLPKQQVMQLAEPPDAE